MPEPDTTKNDECCITGTGYVALVRGSASIIIISPHAARLSYDMTPAVAVRTLHA